VGSFPRSFLLADLSFEVIFQGFVQGYPEKQPEWLLNNDIFSG